MEHKEQVKKLMVRLACKLIERGITHDASKESIEEKETYEKFVPLLKETTFGSDEYKKILFDMGPGLQHHYSINDHHPEHYKDISNINLLAMLEMLVDWYVASNGNIRWNMMKKMPDQYLQIMKNTVEELSPKNEI